MWQVQYHVGMGSAGRMALASEGRTGPQGKVASLVHVARYRRGGLVEASKKQSEKHHVGQRSTA